MHVFRTIQNYPARIFPFPETYHSFPPVSGSSILYQPLKKAIQKRIGPLVIKEFSGKKRLRKVYDERRDIMRFWIPAGVYPVLDTGRE
jgi:hypothetical protein